MNSESIQLLHPVTNKPISYSSPEFKQILAQYVTYYKKGGSRNTPQQSSNNVQLIHPQSNKPISINSQEFTNTIHNYSQHYQHGNARRFTSSTTDSTESTENIERRVRRNRRARQSTSLVSSHPSTKHNDLHSYLFPLLLVRPTGNNWYEQYFNSVPSIVHNRLYYLKNSEQWTPVTLLVDNIPRDMTLKQIRVKEITPTSSNKANKSNKSNKSTAIHTISSEQKDYVKVPVCFISIPKQREFLSKLCEIGYMIMKEQYYLTPASTFLLDFNSHCNFHDRHIIPSKGKNYPITCLTETMLGLFDCHASPREPIPYKVEILRDYYKHYYDFDLETSPNFSKIMEFLQAFSTISFNTLCKQPDMTTVVFLHKYLYVLKIYGSHLDLLFDGKTKDANNQPPIFKQFIDLFTLCPDLITPVRQYIMTYCIKESKYTLSNDIERHSQLKKRNIKNWKRRFNKHDMTTTCLLYTSPSPRD